MGKKGKASLKSEQVSAREDNLVEYVSLDIFQQFESKISKEINHFKEIVDKLKFKLQEKDDIIADLTAKNSALSDKLVEREAENEDILLSIDRVERQNFKNEGGYVLSSKDYHELQKEEYAHFKKVFKDKVYEIAKANDVDLGTNIKPLFLSDQIGNSMSNLTRVINVNLEDREDMERIITSKEFVKDRVFKWVGKDGKERQVFVKRNKPLIDRKMSTLMYLVFSKMEKETGEKVKKEWKKGQLFLNGKHVEIKRANRKVAANLEGMEIAKVTW